MKILLLSAGTRNKIVQYFKRAEGTRVVAADMLASAPALYEADVWYLVPRISDEHYIDIVLDVCRKEKIDAALSLIDPELSLLAKNADRFAAEGVKIVGSSFELCELAFDKFKMYRWLEAHNYRCAKTYTDKEQFFADAENGRVSYPVFVKPIKGSASISIFKATDRETVDFLFSHEKELMIQEFLGEEEIGADIYIDMLSSEVVSVFTKRKLKMRAGETDKAVSFTDKKLNELLERFCNECGWTGPIDVDLFKVDGEYYISEVNPRFGGGYPHAYECGCDHMQMIINNLNGIVNKRITGTSRDGVLMMKYNEIMVRENEAEV